MAIMTAVLALAFLAAPPKHQKLVETKPQPPVEVPFKMTEDAIIVDAVVNGRKVSLMFDTGFSGFVSIDDQIDIGRPTGTMGLRDFVGTLEADTVKIKNLKVGEKVIKRDDMEAVLAPGERYTTISYGTHTDGILGYGPFSSEIMEINFQNKKFIFHPRSFDITKRVPDNKTTFLLKMLPIGADSIELEVVAPTGKKLVLALDTGNSFYSTTHRDVLERVGLWESGKSPKFMRESGVASGTVDCWTKKVIDAKIFGVPTKTSYWDIIDLPSSSAEGDGTVGYQFLKNFNIIVDYERRRVWLENWTGKVENDEPGDIGLSLFTDDSVKRVRVGAVAPEGPADKAGLKIGDAVLAIDGKDVPISLGFRQLHKIFMGQSGTKVKLDVSRKGVLMRFEIERAILAND
jgi:predicted aspartyl protease